MATKPPVALSARVELASKAWLAEAQAFLEARLREKAGELGGERTSLRYVFEDAPAHLGCPGNRAVVSIRLDAGGVRVSDETSSDADRTETAGYDQGLAIMTTVSAGDPRNLARAHRELAHRHGEGAWRTKGELPKSPIVRAALDDLHDHMARRTVTDPDLDHRIQHLGLAANRAELDDTGYTILRNAISDVLADEIRAALNRAIDETKGADAHGLGVGKDGSVGNLLVRGRVFEEAAQHPWLLALQDYVVGKGCLLSISTGIRKSAGDVTHIVHVDYPLVDEPFPQNTLMATSIWALEEFDVASGPTAVVPGSYRRYNRNPKPGEGTEELVPIVMPKGSIAMWRGNTWHTAIVRTKPGQRVTLHQTYSRLHVRPIDFYLNVDPAVLARNGPALTTLCGLDDLFEKSTDEGPYLEGVAYARQHYVAH